jgi:Flp pilus assembly pilin Flp
MQTITDRSEELARELAIRTRVAMSNMSHAVAERMREQRGQTAAEYMGLLLIVALIIGALVSLGVHTMIRDAVEGFINNIKSGDSPETGG